MGYADRLLRDFDGATAEIADLMERAAADDRDLTDDENGRMQKADELRSKLEPMIKDAAEKEARTQRVEIERARIPARAQMQRVTAEPVDHMAELLREFPTPGHWAALVHRAWVGRDKAAAEMIERATAHQMVTDNPGLVPQQIVAPVTDRMRLMRPLIASIGTNVPPGPKFDRPLVTQQVDVGAQVTEKDLTTSRKMTVGVVTITLQTHAGHLNLSKQDVRWSQPSILNLVYQSFAKMYARVSDSAACSTFVTKVTQTQEITDAAGTYTPAGIDGALGAAGTTIGGTSGDNGELNHAWVSRDVGVALAKLRNASTGQKVYNIPLINGTTGDLDGIPVTIDPRFAAGTFIVGDDSLVEFWEDLEGFLSIDEPDLLGQLVGYAGYNQLGVVDPTGFVKLTNVTLAAASAPAKK